MLVVPILSFYYKKKKEKKNHLLVSVHTYYALEVEHEIQAKTDIRLMEDIFVKIFGLFCLKLLGLTLFTCG